MQHKNAARGAEILSHMSRHPGTYYTAAALVDEIGYPKTDTGFVVQTLSRLASVGRIDRVEGTRGCYVLTRGATDEMQVNVNLNPDSKDFGRLTPATKPASNPAKEMPVAKPVPPMFEYVGTLQNGDQLMRDEKGNLYRFEQI